MDRRNGLVPLIVLLLTGSRGSPCRGDEKVVLRGTQAVATFALAGGGLIELRLRDQRINPLNWEISEELEPRVEGEPLLRGHFLCLDRWGAPSEAEARRGVPFHGEAPRVVWQVLTAARSRDGQVVAEMGCTLPLARLRVQRRIRLAEDAPVLRVTEEVTNTAPLGRIYNMVQHPSIAPPFLDDSTVVDSNARRGFFQEGEIPASGDGATVWPMMQMEGRQVDLRRFRDGGAEDTGHDVSSFVFDESDEYGWVTATNARAGLLIGYVWKTREYPWLNIWRYRFRGRVRARGMEFGTTGLHQPYAELVKRGRIFDRRLFAFIDADETVSRSYTVFLTKVPEDFGGVARLAYGEGQLTLTERRAQGARVLRVEAEGLFDR